MRQRVSNLKDLTDSLLPFLDQFLQDHGIDTSKNFRCINPKHEDSTGSMSTGGNKSIHVAHCFGCGCAANIFTAAHYLDNVALKGYGFIEENVIPLANKYGIKVELEDLTPEEVYEFKTYEAYKFASELISDRSFGDYTLFDKEIERRKWNAEKCAAWGIGTVNYNEYKGKMKAAGYDVAFLAGVDLDRKDLFDSHNMLFTVYDDYGRPVGFSAKNLKHDPNTKDAGPKYINTRGTGLECAIFKKGERLYGLHTAKTAPSPLFIFEGQADVITARHHDLLSCCCTMGTALTDHHINLLKKHNLFNIVLVFDPDNAGQEAAMRALDNRFAAEKDFRVKLLQLPEGMDPDELLRTRGISAFVSLKKWTAFEWRLRLFMQEASDEASDEKKQEIAEKMSQLIVAEKSYVKQEDMARQVAKMTGFSIQTIMSEVKRLRNEKENQVQQKKIAAIESMMYEVRHNPEDAEIMLAQCQTTLNDINKEVGLLGSNKGVMDFILSQKEIDESRTSEFAGFKMRPDGLGNIAARLDDDWTTGCLMYIGGSEQAGKCQHHETLIPIPSGEYVTIKDIVEKNIPEVLMMDKEKKIIPAKISKWIDSGELECFEVKTAQGISTKPSETHPYYTIDGWKKVKDLKTGDRIAVVKQYNCFDNLSSPIKEEEAVLLALFLAEGCLTNGPIFSNTDIEIIELADRMINKIWDGMELKQRGHNSIYVKDANQKNRKNRITEWLKDYNLIGKNSHEKIIPNDIFKCSLKRISSFLGMFWACDGWVYKKDKRCEVGISLSNYTMIKQIRSLLLRFGIKARISYKKTSCNSKRFYAYTLSIKDIENIKKFYNNIKIPLQYKQLKLKEILDSEKNSIGAYSDNLPVELWQRIIKLSEEKGWTFNQLMILIGEDKNYLSYDKSKDRYKEMASWYPRANKRKEKGTEWLQITPKKLKLIGHLLQDKFLIDIAEGDIYFDEIVSIESIGKHQCYDLEIPEHHNFIAEDTVVHNTSLCTQMAYEIATENPGTICIYHSIDDAARFILYKWVCQAAYDLKLQLNHVSNPNYWIKNQGLEFIKEAREKAYNKIIDLVKDQRLILSDASSGSSLAYAEALVKKYRADYPSNKIVLFIDNFHKLPDFGEMTSTERAKRLSNAVKNMTVTNNISIVSTVEYRKLIPGEKPTNLAIAETRALAYDASVILHLHNELHHSGEEEAVLVHEDEEGKLMPRIWCKFGKNKVSGFEGREFLDLYPANATYRSVDLEQAIREQKERKAFLKNTTTDIE